MKPLIMWEFVIFPLYPEYVTPYESRQDMMMDRISGFVLSGIGIDLLPNSYQIAKNWNISDHDKRMRDGSILYDQFDVSDGKIEYNISKCKYVEMFETYGIRPLCKIFCMTDTTAYSNLK
nr:L-2-amino-thiazoline-4-carboxylic acid hydrolase [Lachnospiraceae bacterium]